MILFYSIYYPTYYSSFFLLWAKKSNFSEQTLIEKTALSKSLFGNFQASKVAEVPFSK
jgi:hypothetical protein